MLKMLRELAANDDVPPAVRLAAIRDWLDRAGLNAKMAIEVEVKPWEELVAGIVVEVPEIESPYGDRSRDVVDADVVAESPPEPPSRVPYPT